MAHPDRRGNDYMTKAELGRLLVKLHRQNQMLEKVVLGCAIYFYWRTATGRQVAKAMVEGITARNPGHQIKIAYPGEGARVGQRRTK
jgi:hypothetical protein